MGSPHGRQPSVAALADRRRGRALVAIVFAVVWGLITHGTFAGSGDEPHYLMIAHSLAYDADLDLTNDYRDATLIGGGTLEHGTHAVLHDGRLRPVHDVGMPLVFAPMVRLAYSAAEGLGAVLPSRLLDAARINTALLLRHQVSLMMALVAGVLARELYLLLRGVGGQPRHAFLWALLFALSPPILSHAFLFFTEIPAALIALIVFRRLHDNAVQTLPQAALLGALTGFLWLVHVRNAGLVIGLVALAAWLVAQRAIPITRFAVLSVAACVMAVVKGAITYHLFGHPLRTPHVFMGSAGTFSETAHEVFARSTGLLFDREYGLLAYAPIYLLAAPGLWLLWRSQRRLAWAIAVVAAAYLLPILLPLTNVYGWTGGWSPAARFLVPITPLLWMGVYFFAMSVSRAGRRVLAALVVLQIALDAFVWQFPKTLWNDGNGSSALRWTQWLPTWTEPSLVPFAVALAIAASFAIVCARYGLPRPAKS